jgi:CheY-like chemotaxis protein
MSRAIPSVLVVDDEADACRNLADIFGELGYVVDTAHDGPSALALVRRRRYDVALLDLVMPGMDGAALYGEIKRLRAGTAALVVTAHPGSPRAEAAVAGGAWRVLPKPVEFPRLLGLMDQALGRPLVLVVDDPDLCANLWDLLRERGFRVCLAHDAASAVERLQDDGYGVVLLDMRLPDGDGAQVCRAARQGGCEAPVVVITGYVAEFEAKVRQALAEGASGVLHKPWDVPALLATMQRLTGWQADGA